MGKTLTYGRNFLETSFAETLKNGHKLFVPYIMAGDGGLDQLIPNIKKLTELGASAIELGIPFSDPVADGPTIQEAGKRALNGGTTLPDIIKTLNQHKDEIDIPIVFMTYFNPIYQYGISQFVKDMSSAGINGIIIPDLPFEQQTIIRELLNEANISLIQLVSLTSSEERINKLAQESQGFTYAITVNGITGSRDEFNENLTTHFQKLKSFSHAPVLAGFGISTPEHVKSMCQICDGVIVGSRIIELIQEKDFESIKRLIDSTKNVESC